VSGRSERGSALIAVLILGLAVVGGAAVLGRATYELTAEVRVRREALCARYAAFAGLSLGPGAGDQAATVGGDVDSLTVTFVRRSATWCVTRSFARCGDAQRVVERTAPLAACGS
jgi:hypothetical protein